MSTQDKKSPRNQKSSGLLLLNTLLAGLVGYAIWGAAGSVIGVTILLAAATGIPAATRLIGQRGPDLKKNVPRSAGFEAIKAIAKLIAFPFLMVAAIIVTALTMLVSLLLMGGHHVKNASDVSTPKRVARGLASMVFWSTALRRWICLWSMANRFQSRLSTVVRSSPGH